MSDKKRSILEVLQEIRVRGLKLSVAPLLASLGLSIISIHFSVGILALFTFVACAIATVTVLMIWLGHFGETLEEIRDMFTAAKGQKVILPDGRAWDASGMATRTFAFLVVEAMAYLAGLLLFVIGQAGGGLSAMMLGSVLMLGALSHAAILLSSVVVILVIGMVRAVSGMNRESDGEIAKSRALFVELGEILREKRDRIFGQAQPTDETSTVERSASSAESS